MTASYLPVTSLSCSTCGAVAVGMTSWPDGTYVAWCRDHNANAQTSLLIPACVLPGCTNTVEQAGDVCAECRTAFGERLRETNEPGMTAEQIAERDSAVRNAYALQRIALATALGRPCDRNGYTNV